MAKISLEIGDYISKVPNRYAPIVLSSLKKRLGESIRSDNRDIDKTIYNYICLAELELTLNRATTDIHKDININRLLITKPYEIITRDINSVKNSSKDNIENLCVALKYEGLKVRLLWLDGNLIQVRYLGLNDREFDITEKIGGLVSGYNSVLEGYGLVEIRGIITTKNNNSFVTDIEKIALDLEQGMFGDLKLVADDIISDNLRFTSKIEAFSFLEDAEFNVPEYWSIDSITKKDLEQEINAMSEDIKNICTSFEYTFKVMHWYINESLIFEVDVIKRDIYSGGIEGIIFIDNRPFALLDEDDENTCTDMVALYTPANILILNRYVDDVLRYYYSEEVGTIVCDGLDKPLIKEALDYMFIENML